MKRLLALLAALAAALSLSLVATEGTGNAYPCASHGHCASMERVAEGNEGVGVMHYWYGYGENIYAQGNYDRKLPNGYHTYFDFHWVTTGGFYVGVHWRVHVQAINNAQQVEERGWFNRGQYKFNFPYDYKIVGAYNCGC